jgi:hypothetical protein
MDVREPRPPQLSSGAIVTVPRDAVIASIPPPERAGREGEQPLPLEGKGDVLLKLARETPGRFMARRSVGIARYGKPLQAHNGRNAGRDLS